MMGNQSQPIRRARLACLECRRRKVRCSIEIYGQPCTNCILDGCVCMTRNRTKRPAPVSSQQTPEVQALGTGGPHGSRSISTDSTNYNDLGGLADDEAPLAETPSLHTLPERADFTSFEEAPAKLSHTREETWNAPLPFSYYPYIRVPELHRLEPDEMAFLETQKSTHIPRQPLLRLLLRQYFLYAHQSLPLFDEGKFWSIIDSKNKEGMTISLLVLQAILFVASSYISSGEAKEWGGLSVLEMRNMFFKRAKILYDFGVEEDPLCRAQASVLLSYESSASDIFSNSTWLAVAIQHARSINAHLYDQLPGSGPYERSCLKRLWWSLILRDRIIALGMRRPLQILNSHFDISFPGQIDTEDFADTPNAANVYDAEVKKSLCEILLAQCKLTMALSPIIMAIYPAGATHSPIKDASSWLARAENLRFHLQHWRSQQEFIFSFKGESHPSVALFKQLTALYYESGRLSLNHHIAFWLHQSRRLQSSYRLLDPIASINSIFKRFVIDGTANRLPISVVAFTILPQILMAFNNRLSHNNFGDKQQQSTLKMFEELNKLHRLRYDTSHVLSWINKALHYFDSSLPAIRIQTNEPTEKRNLTQIKNVVWLLENHPAFYFGLLGGMDGALSTGNISLQTSSSSQVSWHFKALELPQLRMLSEFPDQGSWNQPNAQRIEFGSEEASDTNGTFQDIVNEDSQEDSLPFIAESMQSQERSLISDINCGSQCLPSLFSDNPKALGLEASQQYSNVESRDLSSFSFLPDIDNPHDKKQMEDFLMGALWDGIAKFGE